MSGRRSSFSNPAGCILAPAFPPRRNHRPTHDGGPIVQSVEYVYDSQNRWIAKSVDPDGPGPQPSTDTHFIHHDNQIILQLDDDGVTNRYLWGPAVDQIFADEQVQPDGSSEILWPLTDHLNTVRDLAVYDAETAVTTIANHLVYDAYGQVTSQTDPTITSLFGFTARPFGSATNLQNNLNRWYDAKIGRWLSEDPIGFTAGDANLYRYVEGSPTIYTDPTGEVWWNPFTWFEWGIDWSSSVDAELNLVQQLNRTFGTSHTRLDAFTREERATIEAKLGQTIPWDGGPIRAAQEELKVRDKELRKSEITLYGSAAAAAAAVGAHLLGFGEPTPLDDGFRQIGPGMWEGTIDIPEPAPLPGLGLPPGRGPLGPLEPPGLPPARGPLGPLPGGWWPPPGIGGG